MTNGFDLTAEDVTILLNLINQATVPMTHVEVALALRTKLQHAFAELTAPPAPVDDHPVTPLP